MTMTVTVEYEQEDNGRWLAEVLELPGVLAALLRIGWQIKRETG